jgi:hypothetical protein
MVRVPDASARRHDRIAWRDALDARKSPPV